MLSERGWLSAMPVEFRKALDGARREPDLSHNTTGDILRKLVAIGLIETGYGGSVIRSPGKLRAFAEHGDAGDR